MPLPLAIAAIGLFAAAAVTDALSRRIPNRLTGGLALLGLARIALDLATAADPVAAGLVAAGDVGAALAVFVLGALAFRLGAFGGGDAKLLAAGALWLGAAAVWPFVLATVLAGGLLAAGYLAARLIPGRGPETLPYGIAIATGGILATAAPLLA